MKPWFRSMALSAFLLLGVATNASAKINLEAIDSLPPGEQYRQLGLVLLIYGGADPALVDAMSPTANQHSDSADSDFDPDAYKTPLTRIVDQQSMLSGAANSVRFPRVSASSR